VFFVKHLLWKKKKKQLTHAHSNVSHPSHPILCAFLGSDGTLVERLAEYDIQRKKRLKSAKLHYQYQLKYVEALYKFNEQEAINVFNEHKTTIQTTMINSINDQLSKYVKVRDSADAELRVSTRKLRSTLKKEEEEELKSGARKSRYGNGEEAPISFAISPAEITEDLNFIQHDWVSNAKKYAKEKTEAKISLVRIENGILIVNDGRYHVGDRIEMTSEYTGETFHGTLTSMNSCEMYCRLMDGSKARIYLKHLRNGRVTVVAENAFR
jgi:hypothetical protein